MHTLALFLLFGCPGGVNDPEDPCLPGGDPTLEIGTGYVAFEAVEDGDDVQLDYGTQGGYHVAISLRATNLNADDRIAAQLLGTIDGVEVASTDPWLEFRCNPSSNSLEAWGALLIYNDVPENLHDQNTTITAEVSDIDGTTVSATLDARIFDPNQE